MFVGPIFVREAMTAPRRVRHYLARAAYGATLFVLMWTAWQTIVGFHRVDSAGDLARFGSVLFWFLSIIQLALALFFAPILAGSSISAEKDRRTFVLLLMTDLTNVEIVLGKLLASLLQMAVLLASALPIFSLCLLLGGASPDQVARVFAVTAAAALAGGSLGILIASWRDKTFQTLALTVLIIVLYLVLVESAYILLGDATPLGLSSDAWRAVLNPFCAIAAVTDPVETGHALGVWWPRVEWTFVATMLLVAMGLVGVAIARLRVWNPGGGKPTHARETIDELERRLVAEAKAQPQLPSRPIWENPVLWREIGTRAYGRRPIIVKLAYFVAFATICFGFYLAARSNPQIGRISIAKALVPIVVTSLILVNVQALTSITSERDGRALDLLLVTDITPREFIFGKIWGVLYNTKEMIVLPIVLCIYLLLSGYVGLEAGIYCMGGTLVLVTFATTLGLHAALAYEKTRSAVINSLGTIVFLFIGILVCIFLILISSHFESQLASFVVFIGAGAVGMYVSLAVRNPSTALALVAFFCPFMTWWAIARFFHGDDPLGSFLAIAITYGFAVLAMLVPAVSEFDVALGRTVPGEG